MSDKPILFSAPMVRALLDGRKTQERRIASRQDLVEGGSGIAWLPGIFSPWTSNYEVGDRLWVKEGWSDEHPLAIQQGRYSQPGRAGIPGPPPVTYRTIYRCEGEPLQVWRRDGYPYFGIEKPTNETDLRFPTVTSNFGRPNGIYWSPANEMPRQASRLTLTVTDIQIHRIQEISEAEARAEGFPFTHDGIAYDPPPPEVDSWQGYGRYSRCLNWDRINGNGSWEANPWVVALTFSVELRNIDAPPSSTDGFLAVAS